MKQPQYYIRDGRRFVKVITVPPQQVPDRRGQYLNSDGTFSEEYKEKLSYGLCVDQTKDSYIVAKLYPSLDVCWYKIQERYLVRLDNINMSIFIPNRIQLFSAALTYQDKLEFWKNKILWTCEEYSENHAWVLNLCEGYFGYVGFSNKDYNFSVVAFMTIPIKTIGS